MILKVHRRCNGTIAGDRLTLTGRNIRSAEDPNGNVQWYICGAGAKASGFRPQQWIAKVDGEWYVRPPGSNGQRGQYRISTDEWSTQVTPATPAEVSTLETAEIRADKLPYIC